MNRRANHILVRQSAEVSRVKYERPPRRGGQAAQTSIELKGGEGAVARDRHAPTAPGAVCSCPFRYGANSPSPHVHSVNGIRVSGKASLESRESPDPERLIGVCLEMI